MSVRNNDLPTYRKVARKKRKIRVIKFILAFVCLLGFFVLFAFLCQTKEVIVTGNKNYSEDIIKKDVIRGKLELNTLYQRIIDIFKKRRSIPYLDDYEIQYNGLNKLTIVVYEKEAIAYLKSGESYVSFGKDGTVLGINMEIPQSIPEISGLEINKIELFKPLTAGDESVFKMVKNLAVMLQKSALWPDHIVINDKKEMELSFGSITVMLGTDASIEDKIARLMSVIGELDGKTGILYMQDVDENTDEISFIKTKP